MRYEAQWRDVERRSRQHSDYDALRKTGAISVVVEDPQAWRAAIRAQAQIDGVSVRTGVSGSNGETVAWALLRWPAPGRAELAHRMQERAELREVIGLAESRSLALGHSLGQWHKEPAARRAISTCRRCGGRVYVEIRHPLHVLDGAAVEGGCVPQAGTS